MNRRITYRISLVLSCLVLIVGHYGFPAFSQTAPEVEEGKVPVTNKTRSVEIIAVTPMGPATPLGQQPVTLVMKNVSLKKIDGYSIGYNKGASVSPDLTSTTEQIAPGDQFKQVLPQAKNVVILCVIFEDGTSDGDPAAIRQMLDRRDGMREQLERVYLILNPLERPPDFETLKAQLRALPTETTADRSFFVTMGFRSAREEILLDVLRMDRDKLQVELEKMAERIRKRIHRLNGKGLP